MKKILLFVSCLAIHLHGFGQIAVNTTTELSNHTNTCNYGLPVVRPINGGAKILVDYEGDWPYYMKTAFQYACEIWEEVMPTTIPIHISAVMEESAEGHDVLSKVEHLKYPIYNPVSPMSVKAQLKSLIYNDMVRYVNHNYADSVNLDFFQNEDIAITYYKDNIDENCSFWLSNTCDSEKYDFVTLVLRDIAKGFGLVWEVNLKIQSIAKNKLTPFQHYVDNALMPYTTRLQALNKATQGTLSVTTDDNVTYLLYAPSSWEQKVSLSFFVPNSSKKVTRLMRYDFGRETLVRNLNDADAKWFFRSLLKWEDYGIATGSDGYEVTGTSTSDIIDMDNGNISLSPRVGLRNKHSTFIADNSAGYSKSANYNQNYYVYRFSPTYFGLGGWTVSLMKSDGSWELLYSQPTGTSLDVNISDLNISNLSNYSVTCDGYLRCRVVYYDEYNAILQEYHYLINCPPRKATMKKDKVLPAVDEYLRDVVIGLGNIEGVTRIVVEQKDEGDVPFYYEISDFKKGYFVATVDKELSSTFRVRAYNAKGNVWSNTYTIPALTPSTNGFSPYYKVSREQIRVSPKTERLKDLNLYSYYKISRQSFFASKTVCEGKIDSTGCIDISNLESGIFVLSITDVDGNIHEMKFERR